MEDYTPNCQLCPMPCFDFEENNTCWQEQGVCPEFESSTN